MRIREEKELTYNEFLQILGSKGNYLILNKNLIKSLGWDELGMLQELISEGNLWEQKELLDKEGFFFCTSDKIKDLFGWSWDKQKKILNKLESLNLIELKLKGNPFKRYFKINLNYLNTLLESDKED